MRDGSGPRIVCDCIRAAQQLSRSATLSWRRRGRRGRKVNTFGQFIYPLPDGTLVISGCLGPVRVRRLWPRPPAHAAVRVGYPPLP